MPEMKEIIEKAKEFAKKESGKAVRPLVSIANQAGQILAEKLNADKDIVMLGTLFMDIKRKQAVAENRLPQHIKMGAEAARDFLSQFDVSEEFVNKVVNCVEAHHGCVPYSCIEAEIVANADCYKFLHPKGVLRYVCILNERLGDFKKAIEEVKAKLEEKYKTLSLDICKEELEPYYKQFKDLLDKAVE